MQGRPSPRGWEPLSWLASLHGLHPDSCGDRGCCCGGAVPAAHRGFRGNGNSCFFCHRLANACDMWSRWGPGRDESSLLLQLQGFALLSQRKRRRGHTSSCSHGAIQGVWVWFFFLFLWAQFCYLLKPQ